MWNRKHGFEARWYRCMCVHELYVCVYVVKFRLEETHFWWSAFKSAYYLRSDLILDNKLNLHQCVHVQRTKEFPVCIVQVLQR